MAVVKSKYSPLHIKCEVGQPFGNKSSIYSCGFHTGADLPASLTGESNPDLYSCCTGVVVFTKNNVSGREEHLRKSSSNKRQ